MNIWRKYLTVFEEIVVVRVDSFAVLSDFDNVAFIVNNNWTKQIATVTICFKSKNITCHEEK